MTLDLLFLGEMSVSGSSLPVVEESDGRPLLLAAEVAATFTEDDMEASCSCGWPEVDGFSFPSGEASEGPVGEL